MPRSWRHCGGGGCTYWWEFCKETGQCAQPETWGMFEGGSRQGTHWQLRKDLRKNVESRRTKEASTVFRKDGKEWRGDAEGCKESVKAL